MDIRINSWYYLCLYAVHCAEYNDTGEEETKDISMYIYSRKMYN